MRVFTEVELREKYKKSPFDKFYLPEGCRLTPAASQFLSERKIKITSEKNEQPTAFSEKGEEFFQNKNDTLKKEVIEIEAKDNEKKPEYMTHLKGKKLVSKNHPRIRFRGKIDTVEAILINIIIDTEKLGVKELARDLRELLGYIAKMMRAEVLEETLPSLSIRSWSEKDIHEFSHNPQRHFGIKHFMPGPENGELIAKLNYLRTQCRELELAAIDAFYVSSENVQREDILQAVNRLSSLVYVMMIGLKSGYYKVGA